jgi:hypothetical protein
VWIQSTLSGSRIVRSARLRRPTAKLSQQTLRSRGARCFAQPQSAFPTTTQEWEWCDLTRLFDELIEQ